MSARNSADRDSPVKLLGGKMPGDAEYCETGDDHKGHATNQTVPKTFASKIGAHDLNFLVAYHANEELIGRCFGGQIIESKLGPPTPWRQWYYIQFSCRPADRRLDRRFDLRTLE
jgi:hypothetical protein